MVRVMGRIDYRSRWYFQRGYYSPEGYAAYAIVWDDPDDWTPTGMVWNDKRKGGWVYELDGAWNQPPVPTSAFRTRQQSGEALIREIETLSEELNSPDYRRDLDDAADESLEA